MPTIYKTDSNTRKSNTIIINNSTSRGESNSYNGNSNIDCYIWGNHFNGITNIDGDIELKGSDIIITKDSDDDEEFGGNLIADNVESDSMYAKEHLYVNDPSDNQKKDILELIEDYDDRIKTNTSDIVILKDKLDYFDLSTLNFPSVSQPQDITITNFYTTINYDYSADNFQVFNLNVTDSYLFGKPLTINLYTKQTYVNRIDITVNGDSIVSIPLSESKNVSVTLIIPSAFASSNEITYNILNNKTT